MRRYIPPHKNPQFILRKITYLISFSGRSGSRFWRTDTQDSVLCTSVKPSHSSPINITLPHKEHIQVFATVFMLSLPRKLLNPVHCQLRFQGKVYLKKLSKLSQPPHSNIYSSISQQRAYHVSGMERKGVWSYCADTLQPSVTCCLSL